MNKTCLTNSPVSPFAVTSSTYQYPGQFYTLRQQCQLINGINSTSAGCNVIKDFNYFQINYLKVSSYKLLFKWFY